MAVKDRSLSDVRAPGNAASALGRCQPLLGHGDLAGDEWNRGQVFLVPVLRRRCQPSRTPRGPRFFSFGVVPPGRCAPCREGIMKAPGLHDPFPARPDDPDERLAITQNGGSSAHRPTARRISLRPIHSP